MDHQGSPLMCSLYYYYFFKDFLCVCVSLSLLNRWIRYRLSYHQQSPLLALFLEYLFIRLHWVSVESHRIFSQVFIEFVTILLLFYGLGFFWPRGVWES